MPSDANLDSPHLVCFQKKNFRWRQNLAGKVAIEQKGSKKELFSLESGFGTSWHRCLLFSRLRRTTTTRGKSYLCHQPRSHVLCLVVEDVSQPLEVLELLRVLLEAREWEVSDHHTGVQPADLHGGILGLKSHGPGEIRQRGLRGAVHKHAGNESSIRAKPFLKEERRRRRGGGEERRKKKKERRKKEEEERRRRRRRRRRERKQHSGLTDRGLLIGVSTSLSASRDHNYLTRLLKDSKKKKKKKKKKLGK